MRTPFGLIEPYVRLSPRAVRWATTLALVCSIGIILTGGIVRLTGSGLGCTTWPKCTDDSLVVPAEMGIHGAIEFTNRMLTFVISIAVGLAIITARFQKVPNRWLVRTTWSQFFIIVLNAVLGGITVWTGLNPYMVAVHFCAATLLLTTTTLSYDFAHSPAFEEWNKRTYSGTGPRYGRRAAASAPSSAKAVDGSVVLPEPVADPTRPGRTKLAWILVVVAGFLVVAGTVTTGAGPHPGDSSEVHRIQVDWAGMAWTHGLIGVLVLVLAAVCAWAAHQAGDRKTFRRGLILLGVLIGQMTLGLYQSLDGLPWVAVAIHMVGAALTWIGVLRVLLATIHPDPVVAVATDSPAPVAAG
ncbi:COX15/CtaA family protein [Kineosporia succinea]|uniref:Cytochrome c oxidase assembly protein subunit 15 n=1 Tax=Kineosporia succinea TaxID=84632 RepID=A0ABT9P0X0_9ACTN|nr:COX15/CtaA family protein [Kineosporia succinea]MDP9826327.1 cytochrome c oxidase assembly protein subunit 15 [Kineosporia succinea]